MANLHAKFSPSGAAAWMECIGKIAMEDGLPDTTNEYSDEGTAAHALAAMCLNEDKPPSAYEGRKLTVVNGEYVPSGISKDTDVVRVFEVGEDMIAGVGTYVDSVRDYFANSSLVEDTQMSIEVSVPIGHITGEADATGTADVTIHNPSEVQVHDLKFGRGLKVSAEKNPQMMLYALGVLEKFKGNWDRFVLVIHQPRLVGRPDEWTCTRSELELFAAEVRERAEDARTALAFRDNWIGTKYDQYLSPGDACTFCKVKATCPALADHVAKTVGAQFDVLAAPINEEYSKTPKLKAHAEAQFVGSLVPIDLAELGVKNRAVDLILAWATAIRARVESVLLERNNDPEAQTALAHKLVQGRKGARAWTDEAEAETLLKKFRLKVEQMYDMKLISPTKAVDKVLKDQPKRLAKITPLIKQPPGKPSVAPIEDPRPALVIKPVADEFSVVDGSDLV